MTCGSSVLWRLLLPLRYPRSGEYILQRDLVFGRWKQNFVFDLWNLNHSASDLASCQLFYFHKPFFSGVML